MKCEFQACRSRAGISRPGYGHSTRVSPLRVDLMTTTSGVSWDDAYAGNVSGMYGDQGAMFIGRERLIANKRASGRKKDIADLEALGAED